MLESVGNLKTSEIELRQQLPPLESDWLSNCLRAKYGVADVQWAGDTRRLLVEYDADIFGSAELVDFLRMCGVPVAAVRADMPERRGLQACVQDQPTN
jgi:hypothetical protein